MMRRERVLRALRHQEADRVPIDLGSTHATGIMAIAYNRLKGYLGLSGGETRLCDVEQQLAEPELEVLERLHVDAIDLRHSLGRNAEEWKSWKLPDGSWVKLPKSAYPVREGPDWVFKDGNRVSHRMPPGALYFMRQNPPLAQVTSSRELASYPWRFYTEEELRQLEEKARYLYTHTDYAIVASFGGSILEEGQDLRGWDRFLMDLIENRSLAEDLMDILVEVHLRNLEGFLQAVGSYAQVLMLGDDLGTQQGPQISPDLYRELIKPRHRKVCQYVKEHSNLFVFFHSCGSIYPLIPDLIDVGIDILNPVQISAADMDSARLKREFGKRLSFWGGGCETQHLLPRGSPEEIREHVKGQLDIFAPGGGYVFAAVHNIQADVPPENIMAMFETAYQFRKDL